MRPDEWRRPTDEIGKIPEGLQPHFGAYNSQVDSLTSVLIGKCNFTDNFNAQAFTVSCKHNTEIQFKSTVRGTPKRIYIDWTSYNRPWFHSWRVIDQTTVGLTVYWHYDAHATPAETAPTGTYTVKGVIFGD